MPRKINVKKRNEKIAELMANGWTNKEIARELGYEETSMGQYAYLIFKKWNVRNRTELALIYNGIKPKRPDWLKTQSGRADELGRTAYESALDQPRQDSEVLVHYKISY